MAAEVAKDGSGEHFWDGVPLGSEKITGVNGYRSPENDFLYHMGWIPAGAEWKKAGRTYLTDSSQHVRE
eukprot:2504555-Heterocapsa_arctica.AAC.1